MSFAATLALIAGYERGAIKLARAGADTSLGARAALWGVNEIVGLTLASLARRLRDHALRGLSLPRLAPYGVIANLLAMPVVSAWVMPMGLLGVVAMPFGFDAECWRQMGYGIEWMDAVALWVARAARRVRPRDLVRHRAAVAGDAGLLLIGLLKTPLRWSGAALALIAAFWAALTPVPDVLVAGDGRIFAVRGADGRLAIHHTGGDTFAIREWLAADADGRDVHDRTLGNGISCDPSGCIGKLADGGVVSYALAPDAFEDDCRRAVLIVTTRDPPPDCAATVIGRDLWRRRGALALRREGSGFVIEAARPPNFDRPWAPAPRPAQVDREWRSGSERCRKSRAAARRDPTARGHRSGSMTPRSWRAGNASAQYRRNSPTSLP